MPKARTGFLPDRTGSAFIEAERRKAEIMPTRLSATAVAISVYSKRSGRRLRVKYTAASATRSTAVRMTPRDEICCALPEAIFFVSSILTSPQRPPQRRPARTERKICMCFCSLFFGSVRKV